MNDTLISSLAERAASVLGASESIYARKSRFGVESSSCAALDAGNSGLRGVVRASFDDLKHPHIPSGSREGGRFERKMFKTLPATPTKRSEVKKIEQTDTPEFKAWFGDSKVVDKDGKPLRMYHGTHSEDFISFDNDRSEIGSHFGTASQAERILPGYYTDEAGRPEAAENARIIPTYLSIKNPIELEDRETWTPSNVIPQLRAKGIFSKSEMDGLESDIASAKSMKDENTIIRSALEKKGIDGIFYKNNNVKEGAGTSWIAFHPTQIKSAIGNKGTWSKTDPNITASDHSVDITEMIQAIRRERLSRRITEIVKAAHIKTYEREIGGKMVTVHEHEDKRKKQADPQAAPKRLSREEIKDKVKSAIETAKEKVQLTFITKDGREYSADIPKSKVDEAKRQAAEMGGKVKEASQTDTPEFKAWFGESKVVDKDGKPLVVYHGSREDIEAFDKSKAGSRLDPGDYGHGFYFGDKSKAEAYGHGDKDWKVKPVFLSIKNPLVIKGDRDSEDLSPKHPIVPLFKKMFAGKELDEAIRDRDDIPRFVRTYGAERFRDVLQKHGYDGVYREYKKGNFEAVAFEPTQIKSAIGNKGTWSKTDPDITSSLAYRAANIICAAQAKVKDSPKSHAKARETAQAIYEAAAIAAAAKLRAEKVKRERELEIAAILLLLLLAGEEAYKKVYSVLGGFAGFKNFDEAKLSEQSEAFAESRQADLQEFAGKLADTISDAQAEAEDEGLGAKEAARRIRKAATKESRRMVDVESTVTFGNVNLDRLRRAGFISVFWNQEDRPTKRHSHHLNEEQGIVPLGFLFSSGQRYPGDPNGGVGECINCGCYLEGVQRA